MKNYDIERFLKAQEFSYETALQEIRRGAKADPLDVVYLSSAGAAWTKPDVEILWDGKPGGSRGIPCSSDPWRQAEKNMRSTATP